MTDNSDYEAENQVEDKMSPKLIELKGINNVCAETDHSTEVTNNPKDAKG